MSNYETIKHFIEECDAKLIYAQDQYFAARPKLNRTIEKEKIFEAGFRMAFKEFSDLQNLKVIYGDNNTF